MRNIRVADTLTNIRVLPGGDVEAQRPEPCGCCIETLRYGRAEFAEVVAEADRQPIDYDRIISILPNYNQQGEVSSFTVTFAIKSTRPIMAIRDVVQNYCQYAGYVTRVEYCDGCEDRVTGTEEYDTGEVETFDDTTTENLTADELANEVYDLLQTVGDATNAPQDQAAEIEDFDF